MTASPKERKEEIARFVQKYPDAPTKQVVDHMMEKFSGSKRHQHRAMLQRLAVVVEPPKKKGKAKWEAPTTGRTSSKKPNISSLPSQEPAPKPVVKTAQRPKPQKGRAKLEHVTIKLTDTKLRRKRVLEVYHRLDKPTANRILKVIKAEFPEPSEPPTLAMIVQVLRAAGDEETYTANTAKLFNVAQCPTCDQTAKYEDNIFKFFGFREKNKRRQSYCRACRANKSKEKK